MQIPKPTCPDQSKLDRHIMRTLDRIHQSQAYQAVQRIAQHADNNGGRGSASTQSFHHAPRQQPHNRNNTPNTVCTHYSPATLPPHPIGTPSTPHRHPVRPSARTNHNIQMTMIPHTSHRHPPQNSKPQKLKTSISILKKRTTRQQHNPYTSSYPHVLTCPP